MSVNDIVTATKCLDPSVRALHRSFVQTVGGVMEDINNKLRVGGEKVHCEADELAFRCKASEQDGVKGVVWLRWFALCRCRN